MRLTSYRIEKQSFPEDCFSVIPSTDNQGKFLSTLGTKSSGQSGSRTQDPLLPDDWEKFFLSSILKKQRPLIWVQYRRRSRDCSPSIFLMNSAIPYCLGERGWMQSGSSHALGGTFVRQRREVFRRGQRLYGLLRRILLQRGSEDTLRALSISNICRKIKETSRIPAACFLPVLPHKPPHNFLHKSL